MSSYFIAPRHGALHVRQREHLAQRGWRTIDRTLQRPCSYPHPAGRIRRIETHISVIYLTGRYAYKLKKPVNLDFVDFTRLAARQRACGDEVRLNRRLARGLYCGVETIVRRGRIFKIGKHGRVADLAVKMRRFDERDVFSALVARGELGLAEIDALAERLAAFHRHAARTPPDHRYGSAPAVRMRMQTVLDSLEQETRTLVPAQLRAWCESEGERLAGHFEARRAGGFVRECHGDLHLDNVVRRGKHVLMFDCIEFSDALRWIDVASDLSFLLMDLQAHDRDDLAARLLNGWLQQTGDFAALPALRYYMVYRALVRAYVASLKARGNPAPHAAEQAKRYLRLAERMTTMPRSYVLLCHGYSGSGKSVASEALASLIGAIRLSSDVERKRSRPFTPVDTRPLAATAYSAHSIDRHYDLLLALARQVLEAGYPVLVDASFLKHEHRSRFAALGNRLSIPVVVLDFHARTCRLVERVRTRALELHNESDAGPVVLVRQLANEEPLTSEEMADTVCFDTEVPLGAFTHVEYWGALLQRLDHHAAASREAAHA
ncbi:AAA family ATPase [Paraburkholderia lacunae]|uniref:Aminoglycoside phosphotransferase n=1 Tax=Paraburkholderia lacunae TaxID=2211104 RepID=A0A370N2D8_9BURK|nr:bifunctional aminoglycoside phosphotransferase/ATP-binding protein [Paraburkholderia lacunae]RDJ99766.1 aminoglycoside phosphotransferase [Paraburkholderia lacunae]